MHKPAFHCWIGRLALAAALLLALVPTAGRLVGDAADGHGKPGHVDGKGHRGHAGHSHGSHGSRGDVPAPAPLQTHGDCDYCPLLAAMAAWHVPYILLAASSRLPMPVTTGEAANLPWRHPCGLGSRGPPAFS